MSARVYRLERSQLISRPRSEVFAFFSNAANLEAITPSFLRFRIVTPQPIIMHPGARIEYALSLFGAPFRWKTVISTWEPERLFVDEQESGPYALWHHTHRFEEVNGGTQMFDTVNYQLPLGPLGVVAREVFVARTLERIFDYRRDVIAARFGHRERAASLQTQASES